MAMSDDMAWFEQNRPTISKQYPNQYVIVKNKAVVGAYPDYASAYTAGTKMFGTEPFVVQQATASPKVESLVPKGLGYGPQVSFMGAGRLRIMGQAAAPATDLADQLRQNGAIVSVTIGVPAAYAKQLSDAGQPVPPPQVVKAMIDSGASISTVSDEVATAAGLQSVGSVPLGGVGGMSTRPIYAASFGVPDYQVTVDPIQIAGVSLPVGDFQALLGRDILRSLEFDYTGPHGIFTVSQNIKDISNQTPAAPGQPATLPSTQGLSPWVWAGIGVGTVALIGGGLWFAFGRKK